MEEAMSDTHAHTAKAQADAQLGAAPAGRVASDSQDHRPSGARRGNSLLPWLLAAGLAVLVGLIAFAYLG
jgi:hypothetical protein